MSRLNESIQCRIHRDSPIAFLKEVCKLGEQVTVVMRRRASKKGELKGIIIAFDKHWNLMMKAPKQHRSPVRFFLS